MPQVDSGIWTPELFACRCPWTLYGYPCLSVTCEPAHDCMQLSVSSISVILDTAFVKLNHGRVVNIVSHCVVAEEASCSAESCFCNQQDHGFVWCYIVFTQHAQPGGLWFQYWGTCHNKSCSSDQAFSAFCDCIFSSLSFLSDMFRFMHFTVQSFVCFVLLIFKKLYYVTVSFILVINYMAFLVYMQLVEHRSKQYFYFYHV